MSKKTIFFLFDFVVFFYLGKNIKLNFQEINDEKCNYTISTIYYKVI